MQSLVALSCLLAVASAGYIGSPAAVVAPALAYSAYDDGSYKGEGLYESAYKGEGLIESQGYVAPVVAARAYAAPYAHAYAAPYAHSYAAPVAHAYAAPIGLASEARQVDPVAIAAGAPLPTGDTVEVAAAKAAHFAAHAAAKGHTYAAPVIAARSYVAPVAHAYAAPYAHAYAAPLASQARLVDPVAIAAGAPLPTGDTVEVAAAKAAHFAAHAAAKGHIIAKRSPVFLGGYAAPIRSYGYSSYAAHPVAYGYGYGRYFY